VPNIIPQVQYRIAKKIIEGDYPALRTRIINTINKITNQIMNTAAGLVAKLAREGIVLDYSVERKSELDGVTICISLKLKAVDPVKLGMAEMLNDYLKNDPSFKVLYSASIVRDIINEAIVEQILQQRATKNSHSVLHNSTDDSDGQHQDDSQYKPDHRTQPAP